jgi:hypothetical protein
MKNGKGSSRSKAQERREQRYTQRGLAHERPASDQRHKQRGSNSAPQRGKRGNR